MFSLCKSGLNVSSEQWPVTGRWNILQPGVCKVWDVSADNHCFNTTPPPQASPPTIHNFQPVVQSHGGQFGMGWISTHHHFNIL